MSKQSTPLDIKLKSGQLGIPNNYIMMNVCDPHSF